MKTLLSIAFLIGFLTSGSHADTKDVPAIKGEAWIHSQNGQRHRRPFDIFAPAAACDAIAADLDARYKANELAAAIAQGHAADYPVQTAIFCRHRSVEIPVVVVNEAVCDITIADTATADEIVAECSILQQ